MGTARSAGHHLGAAGVLLLGLLGTARAATTPCDVVGVGLRVDARTPSTTRVTLFASAACGGRPPFFAFFLAPARGGPYHLVRGWAAGPLVSVDIRHAPWVRAEAWVSIHPRGGPLNLAVGRFGLSRIPVGHT